MTINFKILGGGLRLFINQSLSVWRWFRMSFLELFGKKIKAKDVVNENGKSIEIKKLEISGNSGSGASLFTQLESSKTKIICIDSNYECVSGIENGKYYIRFCQMMTLANNIYGMGGIFNKNVSATIYYIEVS